MVGDVSQLAFASTVTDILKNVDCRVILYLQAVVMELDLELENGSSVDSTVLTGVGNHNSKKYIFH